MASQSISHNGPVTIINCMAYWLWCGCGLYLSTCFWIQLALLVVFSLNAFSKWRSCRVNCHLRFIINYYSRHDSFAPAFLAHVYYTGCPNLSRTVYHPQNIHNRRNNVFIHREQLSITLSPDAQGNGVVGLDISARRLMNKLPFIITLWTSVHCNKLPLERLEDCGSVYGHSMVFQSPQSARCTRQLCFQHYCIQQKHTLSIVAILENLPKCISDIYDKSCGSHGKITFQLSKS